MHCTHSVEKCMMENEFNLSLFAFPFSMCQVNTDPMKMQVNFIQINYQRPVDQKHRVFDLFTKFMRRLCMQTLIKPSIVCLILQTAFLEVVIPPDIVYGNFQVILANLRTRDELERIYVTCQKFNFCRRDVRWYDGSWG